jgi:hypothetical protein
MKEKNIIQKMNEDKHERTIGLLQGWRTEPQSAVVLLSANIGLDLILLGL